MTEIYKITCNICNLIYIGKHHIKSKESNNYLGSGKKQLQHLKEHKKEHKKENQIKQVILYCEDKDVKYYEEALIKLYDATNLEIGLNISKKSKGMHEQTEEFKQKQRERQLGKKRPEFSGKNNPMYGIHNLGKDAPNYGKTFSEEHKQNLKKASKKKLINCYIKKTNKFIKTFESIMQASRELNIHSGNICKVLKEIYNSAGGYKFTYKN